MAGRVKDIDGILVGHIAVCWAWPIGKKDVFERYYL